MKRNVSLPAVVGALIASERKARGLTQAELAELAQLHPVGLSKIERGVQRDIGLVTLCNIVDALSDEEYELEVGEFVERSLELYDELNEEAERGNVPFGQRGGGDSGAMLAGAALGAVIALLALRK